MDRLGRAPDTGEQTATERWSTARRAGTSSIPRAAHNDSLEHVQRLAGVRGARRRAPPARPDSRYATRLVQSVGRPVARVVRVGQSDDTSSTTHRVKTVARTCRAQPRKSAYHYGGLDALVQSIGSRARRNAAQPRALPCVALSALVSVTELWSGRLPVRVTFAPMCFLRDYDAFCLTSNSVSRRTTPTSLGMLF